MSTKTKTTTAKSKKENLAALGLPALRERFKDATGETTKSPNKKFLVRRIEEASTARAAAPAEEPQRPTAAPEPGTTLAESTPPKPRGRFASMTIEELQRKYLEVVGRSTGSDDRRYLLEDPRGREGPHQHRLATAPEPPTAGSAVIAAGGLGALTRGRALRTAPQAAGVPLHERHHGNPSYRSDLASGVLAVGLGLEVASFPGQGERGTLVCTPWDLALGSAPGRLLRAARRESSNRPVASGPPHDDRRSGIRVARRSATPRSAPPSETLPSRAGARPREAPRRARRSHRAPQSDPAERPAERQRCAPRLCERAGRGSLHPRKTSTMQRAQAFSFLALSLAATLAVAPGCGDDSGGGEGGQGGGRA